MGSFGPYSETSKTCLTGSPPAVVHSRAPFPPSAGRISTTIPLASAPPV